MRQKKVFLNMASGLFLHAINIISGFVIPRLILLNYGSTINGVTNSISQFLSYVALVEMGIGNASIVKLYEPVAANDYASISRIISETRKKYLRASGAYSVIVLLLSILFPLIVRSQIEYQLSSTLFLILGINGALDFLLVGKYKALLIAMQKYYVYNFFHALAAVLVLIASIPLIMNGSSIVVIKSLLIVFHVIEALALSLYCHHRYPDIDYKRTEHITFEQQKGSIIIQLAAVVTYNTDMITLTLFAGANSLVEVSVYSTYMLTYSVIINLLLIITNAVFPGFGELIAKKDTNELRKACDNYEFWYQTVLAVVYSIYALGFLPFIQIYTKGVSDGNYIRPIAMVCFWTAAYTAQIKDSSNILISSAGKYNESKKYYVLEAVINIVLSLLLVHKYGICGVLIATIVSHLYLDNSIIVYVSKQITGNKIAKTYCRILRNLALIIVLYLIEERYTLHIADVKSWVMVIGILGVINGAIIVAFNSIIKTCLGKS
ncbi:MAG: polysaccharide biosynthesis C-terminal domain-containing protein [Butyrivibrio sp.]|nr:polysaccharide biosynthesis C-terminal domain-containing protein [Butyrivibrio sp.]